jgi:hypothetical protein
LKVTRSLVQCVVHSANKKAIDTERLQHVRDSTRAKRIAKEDHDGR